MVPVCLSKHRLSFREKFCMNNKNVCHCSVQLPASENMMQCFHLMSAFYSHINFLRPMPQKVNISSWTTLACMAYISPGILHINVDTCMCNAAFVLCKCLLEMQNSNTLVVSEWNDDTSIQDNIYSMVSNVHTHGWVNNEYQDPHENSSNRIRNNVIWANKRQASRHLLLSLCFDRIISSLILSVVSKILYSDE